MIRILAEAGHKIPSTDAGSLITTDVTIFQQYCRLSWQRKSIAEDSPKVSVKTIEYHQLLQVHWQNGH